MRLSPLSYLSLSHSFRTTLFTLVRRSTFSTTHASCFFLFPVLHIWSTSYHLVLFNQASECALTSSSESPPLLFFARIFLPHTSTSCFLFSFCVCFLARTRPLSIIIRLLACQLVYHHSLCSYHVWFLGSSRCVSSSYEHLFATSFFCTFLSLCPLFSSPSSLCPLLFGLPSSLSPLFFVLFTFSSFLCSLFCALFSLFSSSHRVSQAIIPLITGMSRVFLGVIPDSVSVHWSANTMRQP